MHKHQYIDIPLHILVVLCLNQSDSVSFDKLEERLRPKHGIIFKTKISVLTALHYFFILRI